MIGGGIYALTGKVAGEAGMYAPISFAVASLLALITAFSYAELVAHFPHSSGEARYVHSAFNTSWFTKLIGAMVVFMGVVSSAALSTAAAGFLQDIVTLPEWLLIVAFVAIMGTIALCGISQSVLTVSIITLIEIAGLLFVIVTAGDSLITIPERLEELTPPFNIEHIAVWGAIGSGAFLAFYAFIGFEDMVSLAEEVKNVRRNIPIAIVTCVLLTMILYVLISVVGILSVDPDTLAKSNTPLAEILKHNGGNVSPLVMLVISLLAVINGALVQIIMASRIMYGMAKRGHAPVVLKNISKKTQIPVTATFISTGLVLLFALFFDLVTLAKITSAIILFVFTSVNAALLKLKLKGLKQTGEAPSYPIWLPGLGLIVCSLMLLMEIVLAL